MRREAEAASLVDANLILWAHHAQFDKHEAARNWWASSLTNAPSIGVAWTTVLAFLRISTHPRALERPIPLSDAWATVEGWLDRQNVWIPSPTDRHRQLFAAALINGQATGNHTSDAHLAALAIEWGLELQTADRDFARYPGLRWRDPLAS